MGILDKVLGRSTPAAPSSGPVVWSTPSGETPIAVAFVAGGLVAVGRDGGKVELLDSKTGALVRAIDAHEEGLCAMSVDPAGALLGTGGMDARARLFDVATGERRAELRTGKDWVEHAAFASTGAHVAVAHGKSVSILPTTGGAGLTLGPHKSTVAALSWSPDGKRLAVGRFGGVDVWTLAGDRERELPWTSSIIAVAWQPKDRYLAAGCQDDAVHFWRLDGGIDSMMGGYPMKPRTIAWTADGTLLATGGGEEIVVWSFKGKGPEGTTPVMLREHTKFVTALAAAKADQRIASGGRDGKVVVWRPTRNDRPTLVHAMAAPVECVAWSKDNRVVAGAADGSIVVLAPP